MRVSFHLLSYSIMVQEPSPRRTFSYVVAPWVPTHNGKVRRTRHLCNRRDRHNNQASRIVFACFSSAFAGHLQPCDFREAWRSQLPSVEATGWACYYWSSHMHVYLVDLRFLLVFSRIKIVSLEQQDALLLSWLQSSISKPILTKMIGCKHAYQFWDKLHVHFQSMIQAKSQTVENWNPRRKTRYKVCE